MSPTQQRDLVERARALVAQAADLIGFEDPGNNRKEKTCAPMQDRLAVAIAASGDPRAARALAEAQALWWQLANTARSLVGEIVKPYTSTPIPMEDLRQVAALGLYEAARRFRVDQGTTFRSHARWWVRAGVFRALKQDRTVRSPHELLTIASLDAPGSTSDDRTLGELLPSEGPGPERLTLTGERDALVRRALRRLRESDRSLLDGSFADPGLSHQQLWRLRKRAQERAQAELRAVGITEAAA